MVSETSGPAIARAETGTLQFLVVHGVEGKTSNWRAYEGVKRFLHTGWKFFSSLSHGGIGAREQLGRQSRRTKPRKMVPVFIMILAPGPGWAHTSMY